MSSKDVTVRIDIKKAARLQGLGKPLILTNFPGPSTFANYSDLGDIATDFGPTSVTYKLAETLLSQGDTSPSVLAIATYDALADLDDDPLAINTAAKALREHIDEEFFFITADTHDIDDILAIADVVEGEALKIYATTIYDMADAQAFNAKKYEYSFAMYHETVDEYPAEALIGGHGSKDVGSVTFKNRKLVGITVQSFNAAKVADIEALNLFAYIPKAGHNVTSEGTMGNGEFIDVIHAKSWLIVNGANAVQEQLIINDKVPYTDKGFLLLASALENVLKAGVTQGMISITDNKPDYRIDMVPRVQTNPADRAARVYNGLSFTFNLAGAVHEANIKGEMII